MAEIRDLNTTDASNDGIAANAGFPENMAYSDVNNAGRALEGMIARWYADTNSTLDTAGSSNAYTLTPNRTVAAYSRGDTYTVEASFTNTGAATINVSSLGAKSIVKPSGSAVASGDIQSGGIYTLVYDGTNFQMAGVDDPTTLSITTLTVSGVTTLNGNTVIGSDDSDTVTINADVASNVIPSADNTYDLGASGSEWKDLYIDGIAYVDTLNADSVDIDGGSIDATTIGASSAAAGSFTTFTSTGIDDNAASTTITITSDNDVGFGTTDPSTDIHKFGASAVGISVAGGAPVVAVRASADAQYVGYLGQSSTNTYLGGIGGGSLIFQTGTGGTNAMTIDSSQNTTFAGQIHLSSADPIVKFTDTAGGDTFGIFGSASDFLGFYNFSDSRTDMVIDGSGNLGLGTDSPAGQFHIYNSGAGAQYISSSTSAMRFVSTGGINYIQSGTATSSSSAAPLVFTNVGGSGEIARFDASGKVLIGHTAARNVGYADSSVFRIEGTSYPNASIATVLNSNNADGASLVLGKSRGTSVGSNTIVQSGDNLGVIDFAGSDGTDMAHAGVRLFAQVDGTPGSNDMPGRFIIATTADGASGPTERFRINSSGSISMPYLSSGAGNADLRFNTGNGDVTYDTSSRLVKEDIEDIPYGLEAIKRLSPKKYKRTDGDKEVEVGFIADEVMEVIPELVGMMAKSVFTKEESDTDEIAGSVNYSKMTAVLVKAIQEQQALIETLQTKVAALEEA